MSGQHHIIKEATETFVHLIETNFKDNGYKRVHVIVEAPRPDAVEGKLPAVCLYLYQVAPDWEANGIHRKYTETRRIRTPEGKIIEVEQQGPSWVRLDYLVSTWAQTPEDEQLLLALAIKLIADTPTLQGEQLKGEAWPEEYDLPLVMAGRLDESTLARFWGSLNQPIRPAIQLWTVVPILSDTVTPFKRVEERVIGYRRVGDRNMEIEYGPEGYPDMPPEGTFAKRTG
jgi:hypothetical protein